MVNRRKSQGGIPTRQRSFSGNVASWALGASAKRYVSQLSLGSARMSMPSSDACLWWDVLCSNFRTEVDSCVRHLRGYMYSIYASSLHRNVQSETTYFITGGASGYRKLPPFHDCRRQMFLVLGHSSDTFMQGPNVRA